MFQPFKKMAENRAQAEKNHKEAFDTLRQGMAAQFDELEAIEDVGVRWVAFDELTKDIEDSIKDIHSRLEKKKQSIGLKTAFTAGGSVALAHAIANPITGIPHLTLQLLNDTLITAGLSNIIAEKLPLAPMQTRHAQELVEMLEGFKAEASLAKDIIERRDIKALAVSEETQEVLSRKPELKDKLLKVFRDAADKGGILTPPQDPNATVQSPPPSGAPLKGRWKL